MWVRLLKRYFRWDVSVKYSSLSPVMLDLTTKSKGSLQSWVTSKAVISNVLIVNVSCKSRAIVLPIACACRRHGHNKRDVTAVG